MMKRLDVIGLMAVVSFSAAVAEAQERQLQRQALYEAIASNMVTVGVLAEQDQQQAIDRSGEGPMEAPIELGNMSEVDGLGRFGIELRRIANLSLTVYPDKKRSSGIYYFKPSLYFLHWTPEEQYYLSVDYKPEQASNKNVVIDALLTPGSVQDDKQVLKRLLKVHLRNQPVGFRPPPQTINDLVLLPFPARYEAQFNWGGYGVAQEDIIVTGVDPDTRRFGIQILTDVATKELLLGKLADPSGLSGNVHILPQAVTPNQAALSSLPAGARLKLTDNEAYSRAGWLRGSGEFSTFRNDYAFPLELRHLIYLIEEGGRLVVRGYNLGGQRLLPGDIAKVDNDKITSEIDSPAVVRAWYSYALKNEGAYRDAVIEDLTGGVGAIPVADVDIQVVRAAELYEQYNLFKIVVVVRSEYFDPNPDAAGMMEKGYEFSVDLDRLEVASLYKPEGSSLPLYEYKIGLITNDGSAYQDSTWRQPSSGFGNSIFIGSNQVEEVLSE